MINDIRHTTKYEYKNGIQKNKTILRKGPPYNPNKNETVGNQFHCNHIQGWIPT